MSSNMNKTKKTLVLSLNDNQQLSRATRKLNKNAKVHLKCRVGGGNLSTRKLSGLFAALSECPLEELDIDMPGVTIYDSILCLVLEQSRHSLASLRLRCNLRSWANGPDLLVPAALGNLRALETVYLSGDGDTFGSVAACPRLKTATLNLSAMTRPIGEAFGKLLSNPSLETLICVGGCLGEEDMQSLCQALQTNGTCLKCLKITSARHGAPMDVTPIAGMLEVNTSLEHLALTIKSDQVELLAKALSKNQSLKRLEIRGVGLVDAIEASFSKIMPESYRMEELVYNGCAFDAGPGIPLFLNLNKAGRKHLVQNGTREDWVEALIAYHYNTPLVFYLLQTNPSLLKGMGLHLPHREEPSWCVAL